MKNCNGIFPILINCNGTIPINLLYFNEAARIRSGETRIEYTVRHGQKFSAAVPHSAAVAAPPRILPPVHQINREQVQHGSCAPLRAGCCPGAEPHPKSRALNSIKLVLRRSQFSRIFKAAPLTWTRRKPQGLQTWPGAKLCDVSLVCRETSKLEVL